MGFIHNHKRYMKWTNEEYISLLLAALVGGAVFGFLKPQSGEEFSLSLAILRFILSFFATLLLLALQVWATKAAAIGFGNEAKYDKYSLGLLVGIFVSILSFGYIPLLITGHYEYKSIPNLRIGKFRGTFARNWEIAFASAAGPLASILVTIPLNLLYYVTGLEIFHHFIFISVLLAVFTMLPLPLIQTANPYTVYMSRVEALQSNLPGYDVFYGARPFFFFLFGMIVCFALLALFFSPSVLVLFLSFVLGIGTFFIYSRAQRHFG